MILVQPQFRGRALMAICETGGPLVWLCLFGAPWAAADRWRDPLQLTQNGGSRRRPCVPSAAHAQQTGR
jgi:hypothetical protein